MLLTRDIAVELLDKYVKNPKMISHCRASEVVLRALAKHLGENEEKWAMAGLLHDLDVEITNADPKIHGLKTRELLNEFDIDEDIIEAIEMHNEDAIDVQRHKTFHHALAAGETITGLIFATTLVYPDKKLASVKTKSITKRMKEKLFAASVKRENIMECEKLGMDISMFATICLDAMKEVAEEFEM